MYLKCYPQEVLAVYQSSATFMKSPVSPSSGDIFFLSLVTEFALKMNIKKQNKNTVLSVNKS